MRQFDDVAVETNGQKRSVFAIAERVFGSTWFAAPELSSQGRTSIGLKSIDACASSSARTGGCSNIKGETREAWSEAHPTPEWPRRSR
jgi:hypothetical protein